MEAELVDGFSNMSKAEILRGIITEKLTTAAQEIFAAVERTVAGYEEEASGFRQEIHRQRRQLELLLQPRVKQETADDQFPVSEPAAGGAAELPEEEERHKYEPSVEDSRGLGLLCHTEEPMEDQEHLTEPDYEAASRLLPPTVQSDRRKPGRPRISEPQDHVDLRIRILEDSRIEVLSASVYKKYPLQELQCPRGLQEADFLDLLRSTFPQLAAEKPFDVFTTDRTKRLQPLKVKTLTPEEIYGFTGHSALYIRLKPIESNNASANDVFTFTTNPAPTNHPELVSFTQGELTSADEQFVPSQSNDAAADPPSTPDQNRLLSTRVQSDRRKPGRPRISEPQDHVDLRIRILEDSQTDVLSASVYKKYPLQELQCPRGLQEADFLDLLRSTFPQLAAEKPFDVFTTDRTKRLQPLKVKTLTPEEIYGFTGHSALYIRLKPIESNNASANDVFTFTTNPAPTNHPELVSFTQGELTSADEEFVPSQSNDAAADPPSTPDQNRLLSTRVQSDRRKPGRPRISEPQDHVDLRIRILEDSQTDVLSASVYKKYPLQELQCPRGLQEADFLDLLRSTFPQLAAEKPFDVFTSDRTRRLQPLKVKTLTPEEIYRSTGHSALYIRLKAQEEEDVQVSEEELHLLQRKVDAVKDSSFTSEETRLNTSSPVLSCSSTSQHEDMETAEADDGGISESAGLWSLLVLSESEGDGDEVSDGDNDWKPDKSEKHLRNSEPEKTTRKRRVKHSGFQMMQSPLKASTDNDDAPLSCKVCRTLRGSMNMLIKHAWSHVDEPERLCGVCGEHSESAEELRSHLQSHQKTHSCNICGKSFLSITGLNGHVARHKGKKPYECKICHKAFAQRSVLRNHKWVHEVDKPHKCDLCQKSCVSKFDLTRHRLTHTGEKLHRCNMCGKSLRSLETLSQHMLSHSGHTVREAALICEICSKTFHTKRKLEVHMRVHRGQRPHVCSKCNKGFLCNSNLVTHMRVHTGEKPYKCSVCDMAFSQSHCVKRHMKSHHIGSDCHKTEAQILSKRINGTKSVKRVR